MAVSHQLRCSQLLHIAATPITATVTSTRHRYLQLIYETQSCAWLQVIPVVLCSHSLHMFVVGSMVQTLGKCSKCWNIPSISLNDSHDFPHNDSFIASHAETKMDFWLQNATYDVPPKPSRASVKAKSQHNSSAQNTQSDVSPVPANAEATQNGDKVDPNDNVR